MPRQYFALKKTEAGFAAAKAMLVTLSAAKRTYTPVLPELPHAADPDLVVVPAVVEEAELTGDLAPLHRDNYPNALCRHRFPSRECLRVWGFHMLGQSERSSERAAGRPGVHVALLGSGAADGSSRYDAIGWGSLSGFAAGTQYTFHDLMYRRMSAGQLNSPATVNCETGAAATDAEKITFRWDDELTPAVFIEGQHVGSGNQFVADLPWEEIPTLAGAGCYIKGTFFNPSQTNTSANAPLLLYDTGQADPFKNASAIEAATILEMKSSLAEVAAAETTFYRALGQNKFAAPFGAPDGVFVDDGGAVSAWSPGALYPAAPSVGDGFVVQHDEMFNVVAADVGQTGAGDYALAGDILTAGGWVAIAQATWADEGSNIEFKAATGVGANDPMYVFNPPDAWAPVVYNGEPPRYTMRLRFASGSMTTVPEAASVRVGASYVVVHLKDDADPNEAVVLPHSPGLNIGFRQSSRVGQVEFINPTMLGCAAFFEQFHGGGLMPTIIRQKGGRMISGQGAIGDGDTQYQNGSCDEWLLGESDDRTPPWDVSDRPEPGHVGIQRIIARWGTDPAEFTADKIARLLQYKRPTVGPHYTQNKTGGTAPGHPAWWPIDGLLLDDTGESFKGIDRTTNPDKHSLAVRGGFAPTTPTVHRRIISRRGHAHLYIYATSGGAGEVIPISGPCQDFGPYTIQDSVFDGFGSHTSNPAGMFALRFGGDGGNGILRDDGTGVRIVTLQRVAVCNMVAPMDNAAAVNWSWDQKPVINGLSFIGCTRGLAAGGASSATKLYVAVEDAGTGVTDRTAESAAGTPFAAFPAVAAVGDALYLGFMRFPFRTAIPNIVVPGVGSGLTAVWKYPTAEDTWEPISTGGSFSDGTSVLTAAAGDRTLVFDKPADIVKTDKNGALPVEAYWIKLEIEAGTYSQVPQITSVDGPTGGGWLVSDEADKMEFLDMEGPWVGVSGLNTLYDSDGRTVIVDRVKGRLKPGETIETFKIAFRASGGASDALFTLAEVKAGGLDKSYTTTEAHEDNVGRLFANVSATPGVDIEEVA